MTPEKGGASPGGCFCLFFSKDLRRDLLQGFSDEDFQSKRQARGATWTWTLLPPPAFFIFQPLIFRGELFAMLVLFSFRA